MGIGTRQLIRQKVLEYLKSQPSPVGLSSIASDLRQHNAFRELRDSDVRNVVQSMIVTGKLAFTPGLKIELGKTATSL